MLRISQEEYRRRLERLEIAVAEADLEVFLVTSFDSIYYLTGKGFEPLERPFFLAVYPRGVRAPTLLVPKLDAEHMEAARGNVAGIQIRSYWEYPAPDGRRWIDGLRAILGGPAGSGSSRRSDGTSLTSYATCRSTLPRWWRGSAWSSPRMRSR